MAFSALTGGCRTALALILGKAYLTLHAQIQLGPPPGAWPGLGFRNSAPRGRSFPLAGAVRPPEGRGEPVGATGVQTRVEHGHCERARLSGGGVRHLNT